MALNLDFVGEPVANAAPAYTPKKVNGLDLDFVQGQPMLPAEHEAMQAPDAASTTAAIIERQEAGGFPQGARPDFDPLNLRAYPETIGRAFSGSDRETEATKNLPELSGATVEGLLGPERFKTLSEKLGGVNAAAALLTAFNPVESVKILSEVSGGDLQVRPDEAGNIILSVDGREAVLNKPGMSQMDWMQLGATTAAFWPTSRVVQAPAGVLKNMLKMGAAAGATQGAIEGQQASAGGDFNPGDVAVTALMASGFQGLFQAAAQQWMPWLRERLSGSGGKITDDVRVRFKLAAKEAGMNSDDVTDDIIREAIARADDRPMTPIEQLGQQGEAEFKVPLTRGERSLDQGQLSFEDSALVGNYGAKPQQTMTGFKGQQRTAVDRARDAFEETIGQFDGGAGGVIRQGVRTAEEIASQGVDDAYSQVGNASLSVDGMSGLLRNLKNVTRSMEFDRTLPETAKVLDDISGYQKLIAAMKDKGMRPIDLTRIEQMRKRLNTYVGSAQGSDKRQLTIIKRQFDDYIDSAVESALFSGDEQAIEALKNSRGIFSEYAKKFRANPKKSKSGRTTVDQDKPGKLIERMVEADPSDEEVVNAIFGASGINNSAGGAMVRRFREILGTESEGWSAIRREATRRIFQTTRQNGDDVLSADKSLTALDKALEKSPTMMKELFTEQEIGTLRRFLVHVKRTQADILKSKENPSGTAQKAWKMASDTFPKVAAIFGNPGFLVLSETAGGGVRFMKSRGAAAATRPFSLPRPVKPGVVAGATAAGQGATQ